MVSRADGHTGRGATEQKSARATAPQGTRTEHHMSRGAYGPRGRGANIDMFAIPKASITNNDCPKSFTAVLNYTRP